MMRKTEAVFIPAMFVLGAVGLASDKNWAALAYCGCAAAFWLHGFILEGKKWPIPKN